MQNAAEAQNEKRLAEAKDVLLPRTINGNIVGINND